MGSDMVLKKKEIVGTSELVSKGLENAKYLSTEVEKGDSPSIMKYLSAGMANSAMAIASFSTGLAMLPPFSFIPFVATFVFTIFGVYCLTLNGDPIAHFKEQVDKLFTNDDYVYSDKSLIRERALNYRGSAKTVYGEVFHHQFDMKRFYNPLLLFRSITLSQYVIWDSVEDTYELVTVTANAFKKKKTRVVYRGPRAIFNDALENI